MTIDELIAALQYLKAGMKGLDPVSGDTKVYFLSHYDHYMAPYNDIDIEVKGEGEDYEHEIVVFGMEREDCP